MLKKLTFNFSKELRNVFVHTDTQYFIEEDKVNLLLSPAFYWCKKERVGVKNAYNAKKIAHSVFESSIPEGEYKYIAKKTENSGEFLFFAYDEDAILAKLNELGISSNKINNIYFAQTEFDKIETPIAISEKSSLILMDSIVSVMPSQFVIDSVAIDINGITLSKNKINIRTYNPMGIKASKIYTMSAITALFAIILFFENSYYSNFLNIELKKNSKMLKNASLPTTSFQLESIKKTLKKRENESIALRKDITTLTDIAKDQQVTVDELKIDSKKIVISYSSKNTATIQEKIKNLYPKGKVTQSGENLKVELGR